MSFKSLSLATEDGIGTLTLNRPEKRNAMTEELTAEFPRAIEEIHADPEIRVLIVTGRGPAFCAGGDLRTLEMQTSWTPERNRAYMAHFYRAYLSVLTLDIPTIAAVQGHAIGAGLAMALGCDIRLAAQGARMGVTFLNLGLHPGMATTYLLPKLVGTAHAADLIFTGRLLSAEEAAAIGMVNRVIPRDRLMDEAREVAGEIASKPTGAMRTAKRALVRFKLDGLESALDHEATAQMASFSSPEMKRLLSEALKGI